MHIHTHRMHTIFSLRRPSSPNKHSQLLLRARILLSVTKSHLSQTFLERDSMRTRMSDHQNVQTYKRREYLTWTESEVAVAITFWRIVTLKC